MSLEGLIVKGGCCMADLEHAHSMLRMAHKDFNALVGMQGNPLFADEIFGFHVQQAVAKALKAWLCTRDAIYPMTRELARLLTLLENQGAEVEKFWPLIQSLRVWAPRYALPAACCVYCHPERSEGSCLRFLAVLGMT